MAKDIIITPLDGDIVFDNSSGTECGSITQDGDNLVISNAVGDVLLGDGASDIYIGDGTNNVDIVFEQSGEIRGDGSAITLTLGGANTTLNLENPNINGSVSLGITNISNVLTLSSNSSKIIFDYEAAQTGEYTNEVPLLQVDRSGTPISILTRASSGGAIVLGADDTVHIAAGDTKAVIKDNLNMQSEVILFSAESGFRAYGFPNNDNTWSNRNEFLFLGGLATTSDNGLYIGDGGGTQFIDLSRNLLNIGTIGSGATTSTGTITSTKSSSHVSGNITTTNAHLDLFNSLEANTDQKGSIITFTDNYYDGSSYNKTTRAAIKGGTDTVGNTADGYLEFYTDSGGANSSTLALRLDKDQNATFAGNIAVSGTVDGRDVATDGTKLDGIEASATADQTNAEIRTAVEAATDSNVFTDADHTKLNGIETNATADQTSVSGNAGTVTNGVYTNTTQTITGAKTFSGGIGGSNSLMTSFFLPQNPEGSHVKAPWFFNDMAYARLRGATVTVTVNGGSSPSTSNIDAMLDASTGFWSMSTSGVSSVVVEITNPPKTMYHGAHYGVTFGNATWRANSVDIDTYYSGGYQEVVSITGNSAEFIYGAKNSGGNAVSKIKWTFSDFNTTSMRIVSLFAYNYNAVGMPSLYLTKDGGEMFGAIDMNSNKITELGTPSANTDAATKAYVDGAALMDSELTSITDVKALNQSVISGATPTFTTTNFTDASNKRLMTDAQETKLDSVESSADVTDTTNVTAAGALMDSELSDLAAVKAINQSLTTTSNVQFASINVTSITSSIVTSSVIYTEGSNIFGDEISDTHLFNGSITASGNISASGTGIFNKLDVDGNIELDNNAVIYSEYTNRGRIDLYSSNVNGNLQVRLQGDSTKLDVKRNAGIDITGNVTASGNISSSGILSGLTGSFNQAGINTTSTAGTLTVNAPNGQYGLSDPNILDLQYNGTTIAEHQIGSNWDYIINNPYNSTAAGGIHFYTQGSKRVVVAKDGQLEVLSHITASGNISSSGRVYGTHFGTGNANRNALDLGTDNTMQFRVNDGSRLTLTQTVFRPSTDEAVALGRTAQKWSELVVNNITASGNISASGDLILGSGNITGTDLDIDVTSTLNFKRGGAIYAQIASGKLLIKDDREIAFGDGSDYSMGYRAADDTFRLVDGGDVDSNARMVVNSSGNFGIGTTTPTEKLVVEGNISSSGTGSFSDGRFTGNVGIGTSTPTEKLEIKGNLKISPTNGGNLQFRNNTTPVALLGSTYHINAGTKTDLNAYVYGNNPFSIWTNNNNRLTILGGGNVGIGTTSPSAKLHVDGDAIITGTLTAQEFHTEFVSASIMFESGSTKFGDSSDDNHEMTGSLLITGSVGIGTSVPSYPLHVVTDSTSYAAYIKNSNNNGGGLIVAAANGGGGTNTILSLRDKNDNSKVSVIENGYVGIGTTTPTEALQVTGNISASGKVVTTEIESSVQLLLDATNDITIDAGGGDIILSDDGVLTGTISLNNEHLDIRSRISNRDIRLKGNDDGTEITAVTIDMSAAGSVGIGTTTPPEKLTVQGNISASGTVKANIIAMTNIVTNRVPYFNGSQLDDSIMYSRNGGIDIEGHITSSGNISASGQIFGNSLKSDQYLYLGGDVSLFRDGVNILRTDDILHANGNIHLSTKLVNRSQTSNYFQFGTSTQTFNVPQAIFTGAITASAGISASGTITAEDFNVNNDILPISNITSNLGSTSKYFLNTNTYVVRSGGELQLKTNGDNERARITADGNVGIGTTAPPEKLTVEGNISASGDLYLKSDNIYLGDNETRIRSYSSYLGLFAGGGSAKDVKAKSLTLTNDFNDSAPTNGLFVKGDATIQGTLTAQEFHTEFVSASIMFESGSTKFGDTSDDIHQFSGSLRVTGSGDHYILGGNVGIGTTNPGVALEIGNISGGHIRLSDAYSLQWANANNRIYNQSNATIFVNNANESVRILGDGKVGIGTTSPNSKLEVNGDITSTHITASGNISASGTIITSTIVSSGDFLIDSEDDIRLDANGADIVFRDGGTDISRFTNSSQDLKITTSQTNKNIILSPNGTGQVISEGNISASGTITANSFVGTVGTATQGTIDIHSLSGYVANEHLDWTADLGATNIHTGNYINTTYSVGDGGLTTNDFTDADHTKLNAIEASADVTDTTNVTAAGALMDSELTSLADVKAINQGLATGDDVTFGSITISTGKIDYGTNTDVDTGTENVATATGAEAAFFDYVVKNGTNVRAGTITAATDGTNVEYNEISTVDLGDTSDVKLKVVLSSGDLILQATAVSDNWNVSSFVRYMAL